MSLPVLTRELAHKLDMLDAFYVEARMSGIEGHGIEIKRNGNALCLMAKEIPNDQFNSIRGFQIEDEKLLDDILDYYLINNIKVRMDIIPTELNPNISSKLTKRNIIPKGFHTVFYRESTRVEKFNENRIEVRKITEGELELFLKVYLKGFGVPDSWLDKAMTQRMFWTKIPEFHLYIATLDNNPIGASVLYTRDTIGYLAGASTLAEYRGLGSQNQQLIRRINDSVDLGCTLITTQAQFDSTSQRNMQRNGFEIAFTKIIWMGV